MLDAEKEWYHVSNVDEIDSPSLVVYAERARENILLLKHRVPDVSLLRPHVKTNKIAEVCQMMLDEGIQKFKCATIAEAEMLALIKAPDVLLAYQPVGPKTNRFVRLIKTYPATQFSCLVDNPDTADALNLACASNNVNLSVFIDLNVGMNRTGVRPEKAFDLFLYCTRLSNISPVGLHVYDGHVTDSDIVIRQQKSDESFLSVPALVEKITEQSHIQPVVVAGGSPSFATHIDRSQVEYSPGTFVFWDWGYKQKYPEEPYKFAALVITRVISIIDEYTICTDLGHKSVAAENPLPRVHFLNAPDTNPIGQSEEHLIVSVPDASVYKVGSVLYGVPIHICPTVALYEQAVVVRNHQAVDEWQVIARKRKIIV